MLNMLLLVSKTPKILILSTALLFVSVSCAIGPRDTNDSAGRELKRSLDRNLDCVVLDQRADSRWTSGNTWNSSCDRR